MGIIIVDDEGWDITADVSGEEKRQIEDVELKVRGIHSPEGMTPEERDKILDGVKTRRPRKSSKGMFFL